MEQIRKRHHLKAHERAAIDADLIKRKELRRRMAENAAEIVTLEVGVSARTIRKVDSLMEVGPAIFPRTDQAKLEEAFRRRRIYWLAREEFQSRYSDQAMMARHNISKTTLVRRQKQVYQQQTEQFRRAA
ncbi:MAG TPA: hypothetical protein DCF82_23115 [Marinobacter hydrocarbonoclasticus]|uniref:Uncharacterized protein n=1 Tax=Marinobacter nauticus TaxID=2743 RepID=A0A3B8WKL6_MARNT|nr:hypothetical protein [Marinobacter nauticus]